MSGKTIVAIWQHGVCENKSTSKGEKIPRTDLKKSNDIEAWRNYEEKLQTHVQQTEPDTVVN